MAILRRFALLGALCALFPLSAAPSAVAARLHQAALLQVVSNPKFGPILVDASGMTLYTLSSEAGGSIKCTGACLGFWPPLTVPAGTAVSPHVAGVAGTLGILSRPEGFQQLTLAQLPLYRFSQDKKPGDTNGNGIHAFGGIWRVAAATVPLAATAMDQVTIKVTTTGSTVWGKVKASYTFNGRHVSVSCGKPSCSLFVPNGATVRFSQTPANSATWPFKDWQVRSSAGRLVRTVMGRTLSLHVTGGLQVKVVYVLV